MPGPWWLRVLGCLDVRVFGCSGVRVFGCSGVVVNVKTGRCYEEVGDE